MRLRNNQGITEEYRGENNLRITITKDNCPLDKYEERKEKHKGHNNDRIIIMEIVKG